MSAYRWADATEARRFTSALVVVAITCYFAKWSSVVWRGYFTYDDLELLQINKALPLSESLMLTHGDSLILVLRLFFKVFWSIFGDNALFWNLYVALLLLSLNIVAIYILVSNGVRLIPLIIATFLLVWAPVWSYNAVGYYTISIYPLIGLLALLVFLITQSNLSKTSAIKQASVVVLSAIALLTHMSGIYVALLSLGLVALFCLFNARDISHAKLAFRDNAIVICGLISISGCYAFLILQLTASSQSSFLSMAQAPIDAQSITRSLYVFFSYGLVWELFSPILLRLPRSAWDAGAFVCFVLFLLTIIVSVRRLTGNSLRLYLSLLLPVALIGIIVALGRRYTEPDAFIGSASKYNSVAYLWYILATIYSFSLLARTRIQRSYAFIGSTVVLIILLGIFSAYFKPTSWEDEGTRRKEQTRKLLQPFKQLITENNAVTTVLPNLDGKYIWPDHNLLASYNLSHYLPLLHLNSPQGFVLARNEAMSSWGSHNVKLVESLRSAVSPEFVQSALASKALQQLYFRGVELSASTKAPSDMIIDSKPQSDTPSLSASSQTNRSSNSFNIQSDGSLVAEVFSGSWDPEQNFLLSFRVSFSDVPQNLDFYKKYWYSKGLPISLRITGELGIPYEWNVVMLTNSTAIVGIDLRQLYSYSLNSAITSISLGFPVPGNYIVEDVAMHGR